MVEVPTVAAVSERGSENSKERTSSSWMDVVGEAPSENVNEPEDGPEGGSSSVSMDIFYVL